MCISNDYKWNSRIQIGSKASSMAASTLASFQKHMNCTAATQSIRHGRIVIKEAAVALHR